VAAIHYRVTPINKDMQLVVQSELVANAEDAGDRNNPNDPRTAADLAHPMKSEEHFLH
jgi:hypothetical protein